MSNDTRRGPEAGPIDVVVGEFDGTVVVSTAPSSAPTKRLSHHDRIFTRALGSLPSALAPHGSAAINTIQQFGGAAGLAVLIAVLSSKAGGTDAASVAEGARAAFTVGAIIAVVALLASMFLPRNRRDAHGA